ncbi:MAG: helix-turn-helix transcriptional regulator [Hyphomicrobiales bacterium]|nr:helix-turn-helix transcriptional regulator [Hyphomicrobiales bacterium]
MKNCAEPGPGNVFDPACPARAVLEVLAEKWALLLVHMLASGPARTAQLRRQIGGISDKMLIQTLRRLERNGFVARRSFPEVPPRVEYSLTTLGASLSEPITTLDRWVERHLQDIDLAQRQFDQRGR